MLKKTKLAQHKYYVYHDGNTVFARMDDLEPVVVEECATPAAAYEKVQKIVNPKNRHHADCGPLGYNEPSFQNEISKNCEAVVAAAYGKIAKAAAGH